MNSPRKLFALLGTVVVLAIVVIIGIALAKGGGHNHHSHSHDHSMSGMDMSGSSDQADEKAVATDSVTIDNFAFSPAHITVKVGTTVTWTNKDSVKHSATSDDGKFDTGLLAQGKSGSYTFKKAGTYHYHCTPHPYMKGTVTVTD